MITFSIGIFNNILITIILFLVSLALGVSIWRYILLHKDKKALFYYVGHLFSLSFLWLSLSFSLFYAWKANFVVAQIFLILSIFAFIVQLNFIILYALNRIFKKYKKQLLVLFFCLNFILFILLLIVRKYIVGLTKWALVWNIDKTFVFSLVLLGLLPSILLNIILFFIELKDKNLKNNNRRFWFIFLPVISSFYNLLLFIDFFILKHNIYVIWTRLFILACLFLVYIIFLNKTINIYNIRIDFKIRVHLILKAILFSLFTTIFPLFVASFLLGYSFNVILLNLKLPRSFEIIYNLKQQIFITSFTVGILSFFVSLVVVKGLENRIKSLIQGMFELMRNNFSYRVKEASVVDEVGSLGLAFNDMANDLEKYNGEILEYEKLLEDKVKKRTEELKVKSEQAKLLIKQIQQNSELLRIRTNLIIDYMVDGLLVIDSKDNVLMVNKAFENIFKIEKSSIEGKNLFKLDFISDYKEFKEILNKMRAENLETYSLKIQLKPPLSGLLQCSLNVFDLENNEKGIIIVFRDISTSWGVVYDSVTMQPLEEVTVRLYNETNDKIVAEEVTDKFGRYAFFASPGSYYIKAFKDGYHFPAKNPKGYHGEIIKVENFDQGLIHLDILMDRI